MSCSPIPISNNDKWRCGLPIEGRPVMLYMPKSFPVFRKTRRGNYYARKAGTNYFAYKRPHGGFCLIVFRKEETVMREGYHSTSLPHLKDVRRIANIVYSAYISGYDFKGDMN